MPLGNVGKKVSDALTQTTRGAEDVSKNITEVVRSNVVEGLRGARDIAVETSGLAGDAVAGAIHAGNRAGGELGS